MPPVEIAAPPPSPAPEIVAAQLNKAPLCLPPTSCPGWIAPCLHSLTVAEALRLERTSRRWRAWLLSADHIWQQLAASSGVSLRCAGPLSQFFRVASWRRVCVELVDSKSRMSATSPKPLKKEGTRSDLKFVGKTPSQKKVA